MPTLFHWLNQHLGRLVSFLEQAFLRLTPPFFQLMVLCTVVGLTHPKNRSHRREALLQQQWIALRRSRPVCLCSISSDCLSCVLLANCLKDWKVSLLIFKPDPLLRWPRQGFRLVWKFKSRHRGGRPKLSQEIVTLIQHMAKENRWWGAERIHGELLKLDIQVAAATIQKYMRQARPLHAPSQTWSVLLKNRAKDVWACDFLPVIDLSWLLISSAPVSVTFNGRSSCALVSVVQAVQNCGTR